MLWEVSNVSGLNKNLNLLDRDFGDKKENGA